jgi:hypothetical protein
VAGYEAIRAGYNGASRHVRMSWVSIIANTWTLFIRCPSVAVL